MMEKKIKNIGIAGIYFLVVFILFHFVMNLEVLKANGIDRFLENIETTMKDSPFSIKDMTYDNFKIFITLSGISIGMLSIFLINNKKYMQGKEHGSAEWATSKDSLKLVDYMNKRNNIILTQTEKVTLNTRQSGLNLNILVIGGSGSGKTRYFVKPNLMQMNTSYVVTDPKAELLRSTYQMMKKNGYKIKVLNLVEMNCGDTYNPFNYIKNENDVLVMIDTLIRNTTPEGQRSADPFWEKAETALLQAICYYLYYETTKEEQNFSTVMEIIRSADVKEDNENYKSKTDIIFRDLEKADPFHIAVKQYKIFKQAAGKTAKSILISVGVRLSAFNIRDVKNLTSTDSIDLWNIGNKKTILYIVIPDSYSTYNFIAAMLYSQLFSSLYYEADFKHNGRLPYHVRFLLDEFANIGVIPEFDKRLATVRSREISVSVILQGLTQLKGMYKEKWENITSNCDQFLYLGGQEQSTMEYLSKALGKQTIYQKGTSLTRGRNRSSSVNENLIGRELLTIDEIRKISKKKCILIVSGIRPFLSRKYIIERHPKYKELNEDEGFDFYKLERKNKVDLNKHIRPNNEEKNLGSNNNNKASNDTTNGCEKVIEVQEYIKDSKEKNKGEINFSDIEL
jgi:type IV secretion system protein VirD4